MVQDIRPRKSPSKGFSRCRSHLPFQEEDDIATMTTFLIASGAYLALNLVTYLVYRIDKRAARQGERRVAESTLLWLAFIGGSLGAVTAQRLLRHKTRKEPFRSLLLSIVILHLGLLLSLAFQPDWPYRLLRVLDLIVQKPGP